MILCRIKVRKEKGQKARATGKGAQHRLFNPNLQGNMLLNHKNSLKLLRKGSLKL